MTQLSDWLVTLPLTPECSTETNALRKSEKRNFQSPLLELHSRLNEESERMFNNNNFLGTICNTNLLQMTLGECLTIEIERLPQNIFHNQQHDIALKQIGNHVEW